MTISDSQTKLNLIRAYTTQGSPECVAN